MRNFLYKLADAWRNMMIGRNGPDQLGNFCFIVAMILFLVEMFLRGIPYLYILIDGIAVALILYGTFRMFSKNIAARQSENMRFIDYMSFRARKRAKRRTEKEQKKLYGKTHKFLKCPECGHTLRVPKNQGKVRVTCPNCHHKFETRT